MGRNWLWRAGDLGDVEDELDLTVVEDVTV
jgi:hypothetical protein